MGSETASGVIAVSGTEKVSVISRGGSTFSDITALKTDRGSFTESIFVIY
jgi:hypothetical protein